VVLKPVRLLRISLSALQHVDDAELCPQDIEDCGLRHYQTVHFMFDYGYQ